MFIYSILKSNYFRSLFCPNFSMFIERPVRAYSVGSRLEHNKRKMRVDLLTQEHSNNSTSRVRAFSVGSRAKVARSHLHKGLTNSTNLTKANSQDIVNLLTTFNNNKMNNSMQRTQNALNSINNNNNNNSNNNNNNNNSGPSSGNKKCNSTPLLANSQRSKVIILMKSIQLVHQFSIFNLPIHLFSPGKWFQSQQCQK